VTALGVIGALLWFLLPMPFARGLIVGFVLAPAVFAGAVALWARRIRSGPGGALAPPPLPLARWDYAMDAVDLEGQPVDFTAFLGRVVIVNFWATHCAPCIAEMPSLARLREATADLDVALACVTDEPVSVVERFVAERGWDVPIHLVGSVPAFFAVRAIPATYIFDPQGIVALRHVGAAAWDDEGVVQFVRRLASSPTL
jgi:thiol-disulfide isomerase/thioredoxin